VRYETTLSSTAKLSNGPAGLICDFAILFDASGHRVAEASQGMACVFCSDIAGLAVGMRDVRLSGSSGAALSCLVAAFRWGVKTVRLPPRPGAVNANETGRGASSGGVGNVLLSWCAVADLLVCVAARQWLVQAEKCGSGDPRSRLALFARAAPWLCRGT
jgi:hypothetical protein